MNKRLEFEMLNGVKMYSSKSFIKYLNLIADTFVSRSCDLFYEPCVLWINNKNKWQIDGYGVEVPTNEYITCDSVMEAYEVMLRAERRYKRPVNIIA